MEEKAVCGKPLPASFQCHSRFKIRLSLQNTIKSTKFLHITCKSLSVKQNIFLPLKNKDDNFFLFSSFKFGYFFFRQVHVQVYRIYSFFLSFKKRLDRVKGRGSSMATKFHPLSQLRITNSFHIANPEINSSRGMNRKRAMPMIPAHCQEMKYVHSHEPAVLCPDPGLQKVTVSFINTTLRLLASNR